MATYEYKPGLGNAASFQVSGKPYVKGNVDASANPVIAFPSVTSWIVVHANNGDCKVGFSANGVAGSNYLTVPSGSISPRLEVKVTELYLGGAATSVDVMAGLTYITSEQINNASVSPSGSNWSGSLGAEVG
jgi:hypothetical protein